MGNTPYAPLPITRFIYEGLGNDYPIRLPNYPITQKCKNIA